MAAANVVDDGATREGIECTVCMTEFDNRETKPKSLPCGHIFCIRCIKRSLAKRSSLIRCFLCNLASKQPAGGADNLTTSNSTLQLVLLNQLIETYNSKLLEHVWCLVCKAQGKPECCKDGHMFSSLPVNSVPFLNKKITKIQVKLDGLKTQKQIVSVQITENEDLLKKLSSQLELAEKKWSKHSPSSSSGASAETAPAVTALATVDTSNGSVQFNCRELATERWSTALGFTNDGSFLISGDLEGYVNLWSLNNVERFTPLCITMKTIEKRSAVTCLAVSPDNRRIFSGILGKTIDVHDTGTTELLTSVSHPTLISNNFSLQPGSDGQVLAALSILNGFLLFDLRRSRTEPVMSQIHWPLISQRSIMFSPVDNSHIALIGDDGSYLLDLRSPAEFLGTYPQAGTSVAFNSLGTRLLCFDRGQQPVIYDLSLTSEPQRRSPRLGRQKKLVELEPTDAGNSIFNALNCCSFADLNGDVLVAGSDDGSVFTWRQDNKQEHLMILPINKDHPVHGVCCHCDSTVNKPTLAACSANIVTIWSPTPIQSLLLSVPIRSL